ncbi:hypothetical protein B0T19DRAFT_459629 [Cercophora scortea]|uniref:LysM domain-containing protein n=1 Tax=Cercophora scortea TaxID=314031 RepID=A0AAE0MIV0_9PEZI|nr:hypothetical protein B0T19DRAFT_459629 [Cercophora scortea]
MGLSDYTSAHWAFILFSLSPVSAYSFFFNNIDFAGQTQNLSAACATEMQAPLSCDPSLLHIMMNNFYGMMGNETVQDLFCNPMCGSELAQYRQRVLAACQDDLQPLPGYPATYWGDVALSAWTTVCLKDSATGQYCAEVLAGMFNGSTSDGDGTDLPRDMLCSNCVVSLFRQIQGTPYSNYDYSLAGVWQSIQSTCGLDYPTHVQPLETNVTTPGGYAQPGSGSKGCLSGKTYGVVSGDSCETIARKFSVSTGTLMAINSLYSDCSNLWAGAAKPCTSYVVQLGDTCDTIGVATSSDFQRLVAWNPAINSFCSNLIAGQNICISPPGGEASYTTITGITPTQTGVYATATAARPDPVARGTTRSCGRYYQVQQGDYCQLVAMNQTISLGLFLAINPSIDSSCSNLLSSNATATSTIVTPPAATPTKTTPNCYEYYIVQLGDYCAKIEAEFEISLAQLQYWNPTLRVDCSNLLLGMAYCVHGVTQPQAGVLPPGATESVDKLVTVIAERTAAAVLEGGVPYGWPGLKGRAFWKDGEGAALTMHPGF